MFSAAIPFQQGLNHINEQWPNYWANFFNQNDYVCLDIIRPNVWDNKKISFWYKQNTFLYINKNKLKSLNNKNIKTQYPDSACLVHPELFLNNRPIPLKGAIKLLFISILNSIKSRFFKI